jgi:hypothetical protein
MRGGDNGGPAGITISSCGSGGDSADSPPQPVCYGYVDVQGAIPMYSEGACFHYWDKMAAWGFLAHFGDVSPQTLQRLARLWARRGQQPYGPGQPPQPQGGQQQSGGADQTYTQAKLAALGQVYQQTAFLESGSFYVDWLSLSAGLGGAGAVGMALGPDAYYALQSYAAASPDEYLLLSDFLQGFISPVPGPYTFGGMFGNAVGCVEIGPCLSH